MLIQTTIIYCDSIIGGRRCSGRVLINDTLQPFIEAIDQGWKMEWNPEEKHRCPKCSAKRKDEK